MVGAIPVARITGLSVALALAALAWLKRKAIASVTGALSKAVDKRFWNFVHGKLETVEKPSLPAPQTQPSSHRTYRGKFCGYSFKDKAGIFGEWSFEIEHDGVLTKVQIWHTELFSGIAPGTLVEIDTAQGASSNLGYEYVQRVRIVQKR